MDKRGITDEHMATGASLMSLFTPHSHFLVGWDVVQ